MTPVPTDENRIIYFAETDARNKRVKFGIKAKDRTKHIYVIGKTGMGKSTLLENMAVQDIQNGEGMAFIDPHGKTADLLLEYVPKERIRDVIHIAPFDVDFPISFNVLESVDPTKRHLVVSGLMSTFKKIWVDAWSARMEYILINTLLALLEAPNSTLLGVNRMLSDKEYRKEIISHVQDPSVKAFWTKEFAGYTERQAAEAVPAIQNKVGQFTANPLIRNMIGQPISTFDFRQAMDNRKIIIINLSKGRIGDENMKLLGGLLVTKIYLAAMSRADVPDRVMKMLPNFYLFVDEFQNFANASFADILSEARKYKLNLTIAHQYIEQMDEIVKPAVFGNVGTMITFRVGATDAEALEQEFAPVFTIEDLVNMGAYQIYLKLMIDGLSSAPFSARTLDAIPHPDTSYVQEIIASSRAQFSHPRAEVEQIILKFHEPTVPVKKAMTSSSESRPPASLPVQQKKSQTIPAPVPPVVKEQISVPVSAPMTKPSPVMPARPIPIPIPTPTQQMKPVSLSSLAPKTSTQKQDPKIPSARNINDLKNALAAALSKSKVENAKEQTQKPIADISTKPPEVPEEVLEKVLKVD
ncbi:MAG: hypothetical protein A3C79_01915 [Candidatus Taylorbacteria bacterium RIFCSPHIGHO2_02_FULL_45_28]|uniref:Type IV secretion system coupling protein TraD DNA-binding domain-containing protein n=1 Tax=Candidatus Taylorbacteria bacterium RIFCSPHIGHO2_12_FULL_45_16 TaxID=1802315 RepID=A0A1G2N016_9BACT|nr:MAG: hypothetical protein A2830_02720 [Candidatus Taylorbacteria bacterium RIFCSPHIGHO2_01_FULL_44_110]OHA25206.1 MAG: hypothetical protein A3C79_01915 [Candidatus Taylorbacteria bacterium RIFCSPHIGHO2_02_FULL_45_28]OHA29450.1 MAG: hypothetical protein A3F51_00225 [Candidatus Taylorbacteria bacterium RIFCSPHIGHO2_12_FULL_45_16]OHA33212.1 MAG: hypothetical protein A3A23_02755 [Candidatus Taylorbacteria bacterium RIFCSPLOWO2_01_FULL_45_59]OHA38264.1 MAG: hypothetical protein A3I98_03025 [Candi